MQIFSYQQIQSFPHDPNALAAFFTFDADIWFVGRVSASVFWARALLRVAGNQPDLVGWPQLKGGQSGFLRKWCVIGEGCVKQ